MKNKHSIIMILCCMIPVAGLAVAFFLGIPLGTLSIVGLLLFCPLAHVIMMLTMRKNDNLHNHTGETVAPAVKNAKGIDTN